MDLAYKDQARKERITSSFIVTYYNGKTQEISHTNLREENGSFMWFQLFIEILTRMVQSDDRQELSNIFREEFKNKDVVKTYSPEDAIKWYTKDTFFISYT
jgi:hypothetical protein